jgi:hypothetical protein
MQYRETIDVLEFVKVTVSFAWATTVRCDYHTYYYTHQT